jgi:hypothetical protein
MRLRRRCDTIVGMRTRAVCGLLILAATVVGCGGKTTDEDRAADQVRSFVQAAVGNDGASVCSLLDTVRDGLVADLRRGRRVASGQLAAIRDKDLSAFFAQGAGTDPGALAGRLQLALSRLDISC